MKRRMRKICALVVTFSLVVSCIPAGVYAASKDAYLVVSNESTDAEKAISTGSFNIKNEDGSKAIKIDGRKPLDLSSLDESDVVTPKKSKNTRGAKAVYNVGDEKDFTVTNFINGVDYKITTTLKYSGTHANVWVNNIDTVINDEEAKSIGQEFDNNIYSSVTNNFGKESDVDGDGKINILCYDIKDGYDGIYNGSYIGGYFWGGDLFNPLVAQGSNQCELINIDTYPSLRDINEVYSTMAHEFQHLVGFNQNVLIENSYYGTDTWLDEGLSMAAEQIYTGGILSDRISYYNASGNIARGSSLIDWNDSLENYSLSYLFIQYFKNQCGQGNAIFKELYALPYNDYRDIQTLVRKYVDSSMTFGQFMTAFRISLLKKDSSGLYGFKGESSLFSSVKTPTISESNYSLKGGGAVVKRVNSSSVVIPNTNKNITYTLVKDDGTVIKYPATTTGVTKSSRKTTSFKIKWSKVSGATGYRVRIYTSSGKLKSTKYTTGTSYTFSKLSPGTTYKYKVTAYKSVGGVKYYGGASKTYTSPTSPKKMAIKKLTSGRKNHYIKATWKKTTASYYQVQIATNKSFTKGKKTYKVKASTTSKTIKKLKKGKTYYVRIRAYKSLGKNNYYGAWSKVKKIKCK